MYCALVYFLFFVLFSIIYSENLALFATSQRAFAVAIIALIGMGVDLIFVFRVLQRGNKSSMVIKNTVVVAWYEHKLGDKQKLISASVNLIMLLLFAVMLWFLRSFLAGLVMVVAIFGFQVSELLRARYESIQFWVFKFNVPVFVFILVFIVLFLLGRLQ
jgi:hypothetical protein